MDFIQTFAHKDFYKFYENLAFEGRFREDVSDTSSSILSSHNSDDTDPDSKTCLNGFSHHQSNDFNHHNYGASASEATVHNGVFSQSFF